MYTCVCIYMNKGSSFTSAFSLSLSSPLHFFSLSKALFAQKQKKKQKDKKKIKRRDHQRRKIKDGFFFIS